MISVDHLIRAFDSEQARIRKNELETDFMRGMIQGLKLAIAMTRKLYDETKHLRVPNPHGRKKAA